MEHDDFETAPLIVGNDTLIRTPGGGAVCGVVLSVDEAARSVTFADGRVYVFPPLAEVEVEP